jgi:hypothetical protein
MKNEEKSKIESLRESLVFLKGYPNRALTLL